MELYVGVRKTALLLLANSMWRPLQVRGVAKAVEAINVKRQTSNLKLPFPVCR